MPEKNIATTITDLRESVKKNQRLRSDAETRLALSRQRLTQIDTRLVEIGINPDNVDEQLQDLENQFSVLAETLATELRTEAEGYNKIIEQTKPALGEVSR
jgi:chromosome segregation ATPase